MADGLLGNRVVQLEYKIKAMAQRERKDTIWRAALESWILKNFNYDLRLDVQLKLLQSENESEDLESLEKSRNNSPNRVFMGSTSITKTRQTVATTPTLSISSSRNIGGSSPYSGSPVRQIPPNISITTMPAPASSSFTQNPGNLSIRNMQMHGGTGMPQSHPQGVRQGSFVQANKRRRIANNVGRRAPSQQGVNSSALYNHDMPTPIIVSTSSMAPKKPVRSPELIVLDEEEDDKTQTPNVTRTPLNPVPTVIPSAPRTSAAVTACPPSINNAISSTSCSTNSSNVQNYGVNSNSTVTSNMPSSNNSSNSTGLCYFGGVGTSTSSSTMSNSGINSFGTYNHCGSSVAGGNCAYSTAGINDPSPSAYTSLYSSGNTNFGGNSSTSAYISSTVPQSGSNVDTNSKSVQNLEMFVESLTQCRQPSVTGDNGGGGDSENSNSFDASYQLINMLQLESHYAANNYITRNEGVLMFNVRKILLDYEPSLHAELTRVTQSNEDDLPGTYKKRINANVCHFLLQVYGEQVPRVAKQAMADSLYESYPGINKDEWFKKVPHKNATGCINNRLVSLRKTLRDQRKRVEEDPSLILV